MPTKRRSQIQAIIRDAAATYAKANGLRGGAAYHIAKVSRLPLSSVQGFLNRDSRHLATVEAIAQALGLALKVEPKAGQRAKIRIGSGTRYARDSEECGQ